MLWDYRCATKGVTLLSFRSKGRSEKISISCLCRGSNASLSDFIDIKIYGSENDLSEQMIPLLAQEIGFI
jgi:hypothetical protein